MACFVERRSPEPYIGNALIALFGSLPRVLTRPIWKALAFKTTLSMSNMPGPQFPLAFLGSPIDQIFFFVAPLVRFLSRNPAFRVAYRNRALETMHV